MLEPNMLIPLQAQSDLHHLYCGRRASIRILQELRASIYDKALKRKDLSGIVSKDQKEGKGKGANPTHGCNIVHRTESLSGKEAGQNSAASDDPKPGADVGKIVNLMASDSNRVRINLMIYLVFVGLNIIDKCRLPEQLRRFRYSTEVRIRFGLNEHFSHSFFFVTTAPLEILVAGVFLYE